MAPLVFDLVCKHQLRLSLPWSSKKSGLVDVIVNVLLEYEEGESDKEGENDGSSDGSDVGIVVVLGAAEGYPT